MTREQLVEKLDYVVKMARQYEAAVIRVPEAVHGAGERLEQAKRELLASLSPPSELREALERWTVRVSDSPPAVELWSGERRIVTAQCGDFQKWPISDVFTIIAKDHNAALNGDSLRAQQQEHR